MFPGLTEAHVFVPPINGGTCMYAFSKWKLPINIVHRIIRGPCISFTRITKAPVLFLRIMEAPVLFLQIMEAPVLFLRIMEAPVLFLRIMEAPVLFP